MDNTKDFYTLGTVAKYKGMYNNEPMILQVDRTADEQQLVFGWANVSIMSDGGIPFDWDNDVIPIDVLESAAYNYVLNFAISGQQHLPDTECGYLVESMVFTKEKAAILGIPEGIVPQGWWIGFYVPNKAVFEMIKNGTYNMFSIQGSAKRQVL